ncbi:hypothetical protein GUJ93_ZPchr0002g26307 [Zizania palustris]|uniref:Uncharacterized protein n=1 Tax=Zizania palustris TaxID=103762 RepID=A0A8J5RZS3_ZIZPA|nr:hypothetical protein GUJ93_ZPchr0002g26307 [Zizania palustris]
MGSGTMIRHNQLECMPQKVEAAADRQDDIITDYEALVHDRRWANLEETVMMLDMALPTAAPVAPLS